jgi:hypothetical protein
MGTALLGFLLGCGTTRVTDTQRTATEQLLVSNAIDQTVSQFDFRSLAGKTVYFDPQFLDGTVDRGYLVSSLRQHLLASGCLLQEDRNKAAYIVEARAGSVGTDRHGLLFGIPQMQVPTLLPGQPSQIPEIPLAKKTDQKGVSKIAVFAYNRQTGRPVMQSGVVQAISTSKDTWVLGAGPFQRGTVREGTEFAGQPIQVPFFGEKPDGEVLPPVVPVTQAASWSEPPVSKAVADSPIRLPAGPLLRTGYNLRAIGLLDPPGGGAPGGMPTGESQAAKSAPAPPTPPTTATTPNAGGQAETEPAKIISSGWGGYKPDG